MSRAISTTCSRAPFELLTQLTGQVAIVQYPSFDRANVTHVELVQLAPTRMLVILVTDTGRVVQRIASLGDRRRRRDVAVLRARIATPGHRSSGARADAERRRGAAAARGADPAASTAPHPLASRTLVARRARGVPPGPARHGRRREPRAAEQDFREHPPVSRGHRGAGDAAAADRRDGGRRARPRGEHRTRERGVRPGRDIRRHERLRRPAARHSPAWACSARPAWTTRPTWPRYGPSPATSPALLGETTTR